MIWQGLCQTSGRGHSEIEIRAEFWKIKFHEKNGLCCVHEDARSSLVCLSGRQQCHHLAGDWHEGSMERTLERHACAETSNE